MMSLPLLESLLAEHLLNRGKKQTQPKMFPQKTQICETDLSTSLWKLRSLLKVLPDNWRVQGAVVQTKSYEWL